LQRSKWGKWNLGRGITAAQARKVKQIDFEEILHHYSGPNRGKLNIAEIHLQSPLLCLCRIVGFGT
jgi:hypothetical protein